MSGNNTSDKLSTLSILEEIGMTVRQTVGCPKPEPAPAEQFGVPPEDDYLAWALWWAERGVPVVPLHEVIDDICTCPCSARCEPPEHLCGSECKSKGKHPRTDYRLWLRHGFDDATLGEHRIRSWWAKYPRAGVGGAMGGRSRLLGFDVDPRHGGDASLCDLISIYGDEWTRTLQTVTGGGGFHFLLRMPPGVEPRRFKLAPGIDLQWRGKGLVLPPSVHASGARYRVLSDAPILEAPGWLVEAMTREDAPPPSRAVHFQERRERRAANEAGFIPDGERNETLFRGVACSLRGRGAGYEQILSALRDALARCERTKGLPTDRELQAMARRVCLKYPAGSLGGLTS